MKKAAKKSTRKTTKSRAGSKTSDFYTSPSAITNFFSCPRKYWWSKYYEALVRPQSFEDGSMAHEILKKGRIPKKASPKARMYAKALADLRDRTGYKALKGMKELKQRIRIADDIMMTRIMDDGGTIKGESLIWDYKTASRSWFTVGSIETIDGVVASVQDPPQRTGFQATAYLVPPPDPAPFAIWPTRLDFLVSTGEIHTYRYDKADHDELIVAARIVRSAAQHEEMKYFPKNRGYGCQYCPFKDPCFNAPHWQKHFKRRPVYAAK